MDLKALVIELKEAGFAARGVRNRQIHGLCSVFQPKKNCVTFWNKPHAPDVQLLTNLPTSCSLIVAPSLALDLRDWRGGQIIVDDPRACFAFAASIISSTVSESGIHSTAVIHNEAIIEPSATIGALCYVGRASIGPNSVVGHGTIIEDNVFIGEDVVIGSNTVIGGPGFGYVKLPSGTTIRMPHIGGVVIESGVHIGSQVAIDRGTLDHTTLSAGCRIDNLVHIAHNVFIGPKAFVIAGAEVSGGVKIGRAAWVAPQVSIRESIEIGENAMVGIGSVVVSNVPASATYVGNPARPLDGKVRPVE
jgi:UDP-3-O-[3-hydroxymyristoyl] glucosamine N-acyltransferase